MSVDHIILGIISLAPCSGYDMKAACEGGEVGLVSKLSFGSIYPCLKQLEQDGLVRVQQESSDRRKRRVYELTARGWETLRQWQTQAASYPFPVEDELLLKMLFWGASGADRLTLIAHLEERRSLTQELLVHLEERLNDGITFIDEYAAYVLDYIQHKLEAELTWIDATKAFLEEPERSPVQDPHWLAVLQKARRAKAHPPEQKERQEENE